MIVSKENLEMADKILDYLYEFGVIGIDHNNDIVFNIQDIAKIKEYLAIAIDYTERVKSDIVEIVC